MSLISAQEPSARAVRLVDAALIVWTVAWLLVGVAVARDVRSLTQLSSTVVAGGRVLQVTGSELSQLSSVPFVGDRLGSISDQLNAAADQALSSGRDSGRQVRSLSSLLGFAIALVPTVPLLGLWVPFRVSRAREVADVRRAAERDPTDPVFQQFLARRATEHLPYHRLRQVSANPWSDLTEGRCSRLAAAELERLGLSRASRRMHTRARAWPEGAGG